MIFLILLSFERGVKLAQLQVTLALLQDQVDMYHLLEMICIIVFDTLPYVTHTLLLCIDGGMSNVLGLLVNLDW